MKISCRDAEYSGLIVEEEYVLSWRNFQNSSACMSTVNLAILFKSFVSSCLHFVIDEYNLKHVFIYFSLKRIFKTRYLRSTTQNIFINDISSR